MSCANADTVKAMTVTIKRGSRYIAIEIIMRRKHSVLEMCSSFLSEALLLHRAIELLIYTALTGERHFLHAELTVCSDPTAFAVCS